MRMIINDYVCSSFETFALRNAKLIFKSPLHLFYRARKIHELQPYFTVLISVNCVWLKLRSIKAVHATANFIARFNGLFKAAYWCYRKTHRSNRFCQ